MFGKRVQLKKGFSDNHLTVDERMVYWIGAIVSSISFTRVFDVPSCFVHNPSGNNILIEYVLVTIFYHPNHSLENVPSLSINFEVEYLH